MRRRKQPPNEAKTTWSDDLKPPTGGGRENIPTPDIVFATREGLGYSLVLGLALVDEAALDLDKDRYTMLLRSAPLQLQAAMAAIIEAVRKAGRDAVGTGEAYDAYTGLCSRVGVRPLTSRAFGDLVAELDIYSLLRSRVLSKGRYGRARQITLDLPAELIEKIYGETLSSLGLSG